MSQNQRDLRAHIVLWAIFGIIWAVVLLTPYPDPKVRFPLTCITAATLIGDLAVILLGIPLLKELRRLIVSKVERLFQLLVSLPRERYRLLKGKRPNGPMQVKKPAPPPQTAPSSTPKTTAKKRTTATRKRPVPAKPVVTPTAKVSVRPVAIDHKRKPVATFPVLVRRLDTRVMKAVHLAKLDQLGNGGEAVVYREGDHALKIFRTPDDEFYLGSGDAPRRMREQAKSRLKDYPVKLPAFPVWVGDRVVGPIEFIQLDSKYPVGGYAMKLVQDSVPLRQYTKRKWKRRKGITLNDIGQIFVDLYDTVAELHACGMLIGDFKPDNVLVRENSAYVVDAESMAYDQFRCRTYSEGYVDPLLCDPRLDYEVLVKPYNETSDWYAFTVVLFQCLTNLTPYEGVYMTPPGEKPVKPAERSLRRISVFNKHVKVPGITESIKELPEELQHYFYNVFEGGLREKPTRELIESLCDSEVEPFDPVEHTCWAKFSVDDSEVNTEESLHLSSFYSGTGTIVSSGVYNGKMKYLVKENEMLLDEKGKELLTIDSDHFNAFRCARSGYLFGMDHDNDTFQQFDGPFYYVPPRSQPVKVEEVDPAPDGSPNIAMINKRLFWLRNGKLQSPDLKRSLARFQGTAALYAGERFGLILRVDNGELACLYLLRKSNIRRLTGLPPMMGSVTHFEAVFSKQFVWVFLTAEWEGQKTRYILVLNHEGKLRAMGAVHTDDPDAWHAEGALKTAYEEEVDGKVQPMLSALTGNAVVSVTRLEQAPRLKVLSTQEWTADGTPIVFYKCDDGFQIGCEPLPETDPIAEEKNEPSDVQDVAADTSSDATEDSGDIISDTPDNPEEQGGEVDTDEQPLNSEDETTSATDEEANEQEQTATIDTGDKHGVERAAP